MGKSVFVVGLSTLGLGCYDLLPDVGSSQLSRL